ncbi:MAG TPA: tRNA pseudouridine(38-40) synthase TruA [Paludibacteraceae bacterium]|jgi:tRNA pseudouridine38-40 synthase|nr:tRNA pseudouridine(38-40) synthase TruA [Paludibacteraceae bacterium]HOH71013.1 tRNA pseudouridine(38-40) synthase TruA [Paludibacteraceae bacterium]HOO24674.1 tRNA pseudouridine(38-40) synthase TruA [Paludibacteraceae bacterium]HPB85074.1 tRNA pseudouridine(38-40) synthase TruA [Paludibacteraceae bacterium]HPD27701.1 tRNA pseudouridine(38-40) synthase TruA [Paludibacteraceae bacterium]
MKNVFLQKNYQQKRIWMSQRYFLYIMYDGTNYCGWQIQPNGVSVQEVLERALSIRLGTQISITGAGRTDAGVHAKCMVAHFDAPEIIADSDKFVANLNSFLPADIGVERLLMVSADAHARFDAVARRYEYHVVLHKSPFYRNLACRMMPSLDFEKMNEAAEKLLDYTDFTSFSKLHTDVKTNDCTVTYARWEAVGDKWIFTIEANRFLRNMVRAIVGTLFEVGRGKLSVADFCAVIEAKDRCAAGASVPACGLYLVDVRYNNI